MRPGVSNNASNRLIDNAWLNSFKVVKFLKREVFADIFLIKMTSPPLIAGEMRVLRRLKKVIFRESYNGVEEFRFSLENELMKLEHPNIAQIYDYREDSYNFYLIIEYCKGGRLFSKIESLSEMTENLAAEICR